MSDLEVVAPHQRDAVRAAERYLFRDFRQQCTREEIEQLLVDHYLDLRAGADDANAFLPLMVQRSVRAHLTGSTEP